MNDIRQRYHDLEMMIVAAGNQAARAGDSYQAHMQLFNVAASAKDSKGMEEHRLALHTMLDVILDTGVTVAEMSEERVALLMQMRQQL